MKRLTLLLAMLLIVEGVVAQNPKAVFKSISTGDLIKSCEKFEKINEKTREKMPAMCILAEAALLNMPGQAGVDKVRGYELFVENIDIILGSSDVDKVFSGLDITFSEAIMYIENGSCDYVISCDDERTYVLYLTLARRGSHPRIAELNKCLEYRRYINVMGGKSIEDCEYFLATYPMSEYRIKVADHCAGLRYNEAMATKDEAVMELFIEEYPDYSKVKNVSTRLMQSRYNRIFATDNLDDMKWFVEQYPDYSEMAYVKQTMADIEFPQLENTCEALEAFIAYYPGVSQYDEACVMLQKANVIEKGSIPDFVAYVKSYGYDSFYHDMLRHIYAHTSRYIITPDLTNATLLHFANEDGMSGYMDLEGNLVIEAIYSSERPEIGSARYNAFMLSEFTTNRDVAVVKLNGSWGAINSKGDTIVPHKYEAVTIYDNQIFAIPDLSKSFSEDEDAECCLDNGRYCDIYDFSGELLKSNVGVYFTDYNTVLGYRMFETTDGRVMGSYLTPKYCMDVDDDGIKLIKQDGTAVPVSWTSDEGVTDNIVVINLNENGMSGRYYVDLDKMEALKKCPWARVYPMSCGRAMVFDGNKYGFIDEDLELVIPCQYDIDESYSFNCGYMVVRSDDKYILIDVDGDRVSDRFEKIYDLQAYGGMTYNIPGIFITYNSGIYKVFDATAGVLAELESAFVPTVVGNYVIDSNQNRIMFNLAIEE